MRPRAGIEHEIKPPLIESEDEVAAYIRSIDFGPMKVNILDDPTLDWDADKVDFVEEQYKNWLLLRRLNLPDPAVVPPTEPDLDTFWHFHILDTYSYVRDCSSIFGSYHHHFPYFGIRDDEDLEDLIDASQETRRQYLERFDTPLESYEEHRERVRDESVTP